MHLAGKARFPRHSKPRARIRNQTPTADSTLFSLFYFVSIFPEACSSTRRSECAPPLHVAIKQSCYGVQRFFNRITRYFVRRTISRETMKKFVSAMRNEFRRFSHALYSFVYIFMIHYFARDESRICNTRGGSLKFSH